MYTIYILYSLPHNKIYIGFTTNIAARFLSHNQLGNKGWAIKYRPWQIIHTEVFNTKQEALLREKELKTGKGREWIWNELIANLQL
ncbi:GIY-YIG nuclease family protein [Parafilimonas terrae]|uniref:Putative endonuclease n=1 Tax=Parafilimonas terrae TaxID=1465490 RepID=A0A1I5XQM6_9BACT|nr:GIY-YIG nuclease family protein [Parafilimonas terrae]SFQ34254.1 putative endonuclease [Parafilimonas terrae]